MPSVRIAIAAMIVLLAANAPSGAGCRLALVLALDVSASVDAGEYRLQATGMAQALVAPDVASEILDDPANPVAIAAFVWSGPGDQALIADWTLIDSAERLRVLARTIAGHPRRTSFDGRTAIGSAMAQGARLQAAAPPCDRQVIDFASDGENNAGIDPASQRDAPTLRHVTINALAITGQRPHDLPRNDQPLRSLRDYLRANVIRGPDAFVETAFDYHDFERAMTRKLLRELRPLMVSAD